MQRVTRLGTLVVVATLLCAGPAVAQVQTGSILVKVVDEQGAVVPGVTATISGPSLVAGQMIGVTDAGGIYRFPVPPAGDLFRQARPHRLPVHHPARHPRQRRPDDAGRSRADGGASWPRR